MLGHKTRDGAESLNGYLQPGSFRFLVALRTNTQHLSSERFAFVPRLPVDRESGLTRIFMSSTTLPMTKSTSSSRRSGPWSSTGDGMERRY